MHIIWYLPSENNEIGFQIGSHNLIKTSGVFKITKINTNFIHDSHNLESYFNLYIRKFKKKKLIEKMDIAEDYLLDKLNFDCMYVIKGYLF
jgi:hypothetical protein